MSRAEIELLLLDIFPEKGIVKWILSFEDFPHDLIRKFVNPYVSLKQGFVELNAPHFCYSCRDKDKQHSTLLCFYASGLIVVTWCDALHLEVLAGPRKYICLTSNSTSTFVVGYGFVRKTEFQEDEIWTVLRKHFTFFLTV